MLKILLFLSLFLGVSCSNSETVQNTSKSEEPFFESNLSEADRLALANAKGRSVKLISISDLHQKIEDSKEQLHIFCFWKVYHNESKSLVKNLRDVHRELGQEKFKINYINLDQQTLLKEINTFVRELGIIEDIYRLSEPAEGQLLATGTYNWNNQLPLLILKNQSDGTNLMYQNHLDVDEMIAYLQPLIL